MWILLTGALNAATQPGLKSLTVKLIGWHVSEKIESAAMFILIL